MEEDSFGEYCARNLDDELLPTRISTDQKDAGQRCPQLFQGADPNQHINDRLVASIAFSSRRQYLTSNHSMHATLVDGIKVVGVDHLTVRNHGIFFVSLSELMFDRSRKITRTRPCDRHIAPSTGYRTLDRTRSLPSWQVPASSALGSGCIFSLTRRMCRYLLPNATRLCAIGSSRTQEINAKWAKGNFLRGERSGES